MGLITNQGAIIIAQKQQANQSLNITTFKIGDSSTAFTGTETDIHSPRYTGQVSSITRDGSSLSFECVIPSNVGGFYVRELGIFDNDGFLIAVTSLQNEKYKEANSGSIFSTMRINFTISTSNASTINLTFNNSSIFASVGYVDSSVSSAISPIQTNITNLSNSLSSTNTNIQTVDNKITASNILNLIKTVDGDGSGLDADTLKGLAPSAMQVPSGAVMVFAMPTPPIGWLKCNGQAVSRTTYASLFSAIGTTFGVGDGSTTFNVPDNRGEFIRCYDDGRGVDSGRIFGSYQADDFKAHTHTITSTTDDGGGGTTYAEGSSSMINGATKTSGSTGGSETRPRNVAYLCCIKI